MINTHSQMARQHQELYDENYQERLSSYRSRRSSRDTSRRGTPQEIEDTLDEVR